MVDETKRVFTGVIRKKEANRYIEEVAPIQVVEDTVIPYRKKKHPYLKVYFSSLYLINDSLLTIKL